MRRQAGPHTKCRTGQKAAASHCELLQKVSVGLHVSFSSGVRATPVPPKRCQPSSGVLSSCSRTTAAPLTHRRDARRQRSPLRIGSRSARRSGQDRSSARAARSPTALRRLPSPASCPRCGSLVWMPTSYRANLRRLLMRCSDRSTEPCAGPRTNVVASRPTPSARPKAQKPTVLTQQARQTAHRGDDVLVARPQGQFTRLRGRSHRVLAAGGARGNDPHAMAGTVRRGPRWASWRRQGRARPDGPGGTVAGA